MGGQKRVEDARKTRWCPRIHLLRRTFLQRWLIAVSSPAWRVWVSAGDR